jgi:hypothetical protein
MQRAGQAKPTTYDGAGDWPSRAQTPGLRPAVVNELLLSPVRSRTAG